MRFFLRWFVTFAILLLSIQVIYAAEDNAKSSRFFLYVTNNTPYVAHIAKSHYNKTPFTLLTTSVAPYSKEVKIGEVHQLPTVANPVSFYARVGDTQSYFNTPLVRYGLTEVKKDVRLEPHGLTIADQEYAAEVFAHEESESHSILLSIEPSSHQYRKKPLYQ